MKQRQLQAFIDEELWKKVQVKAIMDGTLAAEVVALILRDYFEKKPLKV